MSHRIDEEGLRIPVLKAKHEIEILARQAGIPTTVVRPGDLVESTFAVG